MGEGFIERDDRWAISLGKPSDTFEKVPGALGTRGSLSLVLRRRWRGVLGRRWESAVNELSLVTMKLGVANVDIRGRGPVLILKVYLDGRHGPFSQARGTGHVEFGNLSGSIL